MIIYYFFIKVKQTTRRTKNDLFYGISPFCFVIFTKGLSVKLMKKR